MLKKQEKRKANNRGAKKKITARKTDSPKILFITVKYRQDRLKQNTHASFNI